MSTTAEIPGTPVRSPHARVRREVLAALRGESKTLHLMIWRWGQGAGRIAYEVSGKRWRRIEEYPENDWIGLRADAYRLREIATALTAMAERLEGEAWRAEAAPETWRLGDGS